MLRRCLNPKCKEYKHYGARGITVCQRWMEFEKFLQDMGPTFVEGLTLERKDNDSGYSPENCVWATMSQQHRNYRQNHIIEYRGERFPITVWAEKMKLTDRALRMRIRSGWTVERALTTPLDHYRQASRASAILTHNNTTMTLKDWAHKIGISKGGMLRRIHVYGWSIERALTTPPTPGKKANTCIKR